MSVLPGWTTAPLGYLVRLEGGSTPSKENLAFWNGTIPWVSPKDMKRFDISDAEDHVTDEALRSTSLRLIEGPAVLTVVRGMILDHTVPVARLQGAVSLNQDMKALKPVARIDASFLSYALLARQPELLALVERAGHGTCCLRTDGLTKLRVSFPSLSLQRDIADFLDRKTAAIDALIEQKERLRDVAAEKRQALIHQAISQGLDPTVACRASGVEWLGPVPSHWDILPLKRLASSRRHSFTDGDWIESPYITDTGVRLLQTGNVGTGYYKEQGFRYIAEDTFKALGCTEVSPGDVLVCRLDGPVGRACIAPELGCRMITSVDNAILKVAPQHDARFVVYALTVPEYLEWVQALCRVGGGFRFRVSRSMLGDFKLPAPPLAEQRAIADHLDAATSALRTLEQQLSDSVDALREYRQAVITAAVTGKLDVTSTSKEAA